MPSPPCRNCGSTSTATFCAECGQHQSDAIVPLGTWLSDLAHGFLNFEYRLPRTVWSLLLDPGLLTNEYAAGRRASQTGPLRVYIVTSAAIIALMIAMGSFARVEGGAAIQAIFPLVNLISPILIGVLMQAVFPRELFALNLLFGTHFATVVVIVGVPIIFVPAQFEPLALAGMTGVLVGHLGVAIRRVYDCGKLRAFSSALAVYVLYWAIVQATIFVLIRAMTSDPST